MNFTDKELERIHAYTVSKELVGSLAAELIESKKIIKRLEGALRSNITHTSNACRESYLQALNDVIANATDNDVYDGDVIGYYIPVDNIDKLKAAKEAE